MAVLHAKTLYDETMRIQALFSLLIIGAAPWFAIAQEDVSATADSGKTQLTLDQLRTFSEVFGRVQRDYVGETNDVDLLENAIRGLLTDLDPHTAYLNPKQFKALDADNQGEYGGIGVEVLWISGDMSVVAVTPGGPAERAGIRVGDLIIGIGGLSLDELRGPDAMDRVRGPAGTTVQLTVVNDEDGVERELTVVRESISVASVESRLLEGRYAYANVLTFQTDTAEELSEQLGQLADQSGSSLEGLVLDLRANPGGVLSAAVGMVDLFLTEGLIVYTRGRSEQAELSFSAGPEDELDGAPIVILVDGQSASASEVVAGALQDHGRALIMGSRTFGKGSVQSLIPLRNGGAVKLTTSRYYTPSGRSIQASGIAPDVDLSGDQYADEVLSKPRRESDLDNHLSGESLDAVDDAGGEKLEDYAVYRALSLLRSAQILSRRPAESSSM